MHKKTILLELPAEIVDKIDQQNMTGDRSTFISHLLDSQFKTDLSLMDVMGEESELSSRMREGMADVPFSGELRLTTAQGKHMGNFNINTVEGFTQMAETIARISDDPLVRMKARKML